MVELAAASRPAARPRPASTPSPTGATRRRAPPTATCPSSRPASPGTATRGDGQRPLLRHGPRPALGADAAGVRGDRPWPSVSWRRIGERRPSLRRTGAARTTSSSCRRSSRPLRADGDGDVGRAPQLPGRPRAAADAGTGAARLRRLRSRPAARDLLGGHAHRVPVARRAAGARSRSRRWSSTRWPPTWRASASGSSTSPRRRSTPTSPTSSTAVSSSRSPARTASSCRRTGTCRPTTSRRRCARSDHRRLVAGTRLRRATTSSSPTTPTPTWSATPACGTRR